MAPRKERCSFQYQPLPDAKTHIRLLEVVDLDETSRFSVRCRLTAWLLDDAPPYCAISYTWGAPGDTTTILINAKRFQVRPNCEYVLKQAKWYGDKHASLTRKHKQYRYFWCDAICINQTDLEEKSHQVAMMGGIYRRAQRVLACAGKHEGDSRFLFDIIQWQSIFLEIRARAEVLPVYKANRPRAALRHIADKPWMMRLWLPFMRYKSTILRVIQGLDEFFSRQYFSRLWVYQELYLGKHILLCCGRDTVTMSALCGMVEALYEQYSDRPCRNIMEMEGIRISQLPLSTLNRKRKMLRDAVNAPGSMKTFEGVFAATQYMQLTCQDIRDQVYGILSLVEWLPRQTPIHSDYNLDAFDLGVKVIQAQEFTFPMVKRVAQAFDLNRNPTPRLLQALQRRSGPFLKSNVNEKTPIDRYGTIPPSDTGWHGIKLQGDAINQLFDSPALNDVPLVIHKWPIINASVESVSKVVLPLNAIPGDWFLYQSESQTARPALIVRRLTAGNLFTIVGRALLLGGFHIEGLDLSPYMEVRKFHVRWDVRDVLTLACSWPQNGFDLQDRAQLGTYMEMRIESIGETVTYAKLVE